MDPVYAAIAGEPARDIAGNPGNIHHPGRRPNLAFAGSGLACRQVWRAHADHDRMPVVGSRLDRSRLRRVTDKPVSDLRPVMRDRHGDRLCGNHRPGRPLVSGQARFRHRVGRRRIWLWCHFDDVSDRHDHAKLGLSHRADHVRNYPRPHRSGGGLGDANAWTGRCAPAFASRQTGRRYFSTADVEVAYFLADVCNDDDDVHRRPYDHLAVRRFLPRLRGRGCNPFWCRSAAVGTDDRPDDERSHASLFRLGFRQDRP